MFDIIAHCGPFAILGVGITLWAIWASLKVITLLSLLAGGLCSAFCGLICGGISTLGLVVIKMIAKILLVGVLIPLILNIFLKKIYYSILEENKITIKYIKRIAYISFLNPMITSTSLLLQYYFSINGGFLNLLYLLSIGSTSLLLIGAGYQLLTDRYYSIFNEKLNLTKVQFEMNKHSLLGSFLLSLLGLIFAIDRI